MASVEDEPMEVDVSINATGINDKPDDADVSDEGLIEDENIIESRYENKAGTFTTGINIFGEEERRKMEERAKRFGLKENNKAIAENGEDLYSSMGVLEENDNSKYVRLNVIHMRGTEDMSTKDVFKYFEDYAPASIEWINDISCNVVWLDNISAARALLGLSKRISGLSEKLQRENKEAANDNDLVNVENNSAEENMIQLKDIQCPLPPGLWRKGVDYPKSKAIFLRFAMKSDKKQPRAERMSEYYKKYGNPNFGGERGLLTESRKRQYRQIRTGKSRRSSDNDENGEKKKNPWGDLSENWGAAENVEDSYVNRGSVAVERESVREPENSVRGTERGSVKERLGIRPPREVEVETPTSSESESDDSDEEWMRKSKVPRMRMHADDEEEKVKKRKLKQLITNPVREEADLRSRLGRRRLPPQYREDIQVIVTNNPEKYRARLEEEEEEEEEEAASAEEIVESEKEEGEWEEGEVVEEIEEVEEVPQEVAHEEEEEGGTESDSETSSSSELSEKEVQGPKGSVIKVVPRSKPRVASTVWARLNYNNQSDSKPESRNSKSLRADLRLRLGNTRKERSPLRIEVKNDNFHRDDSD